MDILNKRWTFFPLFLTVAFFVSTLYAQEPPKNGTVFKMNALLISLEDYDQGKLDFAKEDLDKLSEVLMYNFGCTSKLVYNNPSSAQLTSTSPDRYKKSIEEEIVDWCARLKSDNIAILYLAGHGIADDSGKLYFPMLNFKSEEVKSPFEEAAIPISWIREQFEKAQCRCRLVLLDACYSGTSKDLSDSGDTFKLACTFNSPPDAVLNIATLASSGDKQKSWLWEEEKHSLFTYWIIDALSGNADQNKDGNIILTELYNYVRENVSKVSEQNRKMMPQTPVLLNEEAIRDDFIITCPARKSSEALQAIYKKINARILKEGMTHLIVTPEFTTGTNTGQIDTSEYGTLPKLFADEIRTKLATDEDTFGEEKPYFVIQESQTRKILKENGLNSGNIGTEDAVVLKTGKYKIDGVIDGKITFLTPNTVSITVILHSLKTGNAKPYPAKVFLTPEELASAGMSFAIKEKPPTDTQPRYIVTNAGLVNKTTLDQVQEVLDENTAKRNPMADKSLPFTLEIRSRREKSEDVYTKCDGKIIDGVYYVAIDKNEEYGICLTNNDPKEELYFVKVLVDGLNTISQPMRTISQHLKTETLEPGEKGIFVTPSQAENGTMVFAPRVSLEEARAWLVFNPNAGMNQNVLELYGFCEENGERSDSYRFLVGDADQSLAARQNYTEKIGLITVAIYYGISKGSKRGGSAGTLRGEKFRTPVNYYQGDKEPDALRCVYTIRYVSREEFQKLP